MIPFISELVASTEGDLRSMSLGVLSKPSRPTRTWQISYRSAVSMSRTTREQEGLLEKAIGGELEMVPGSERNTTGQRLFALTDWL